MVTSDTVGTWSGARREMESEGWLVVRTLVGGTKAMRNARTTFTPQTDGERKEVGRYNARLLRSVLFPAYARTVKKIASLPFQKPPTIQGELPEPIDRIIADADRCGTSLASFGQEIYRDAVNCGMGLFLVDNVPVGGLTLTEADELDARPYFCRINPDNFMGAAVEKRYGRDVVVEFRYREWVWAPSKLGYDTLVDRIRVWTEQEVQVWERDTSQTDVDRTAASSTSTTGGYRMVESIPHGFGRIPLVVVYTDKVDTLNARPPLLDLAWLNVAHWQSDSTQKDALAYCRAPTLFGKGLDAETVESKPQLGSGSTVMTKSETADFGFIEIGGASLAAGREDIQALAEMMAAIGMQPLMAVQGPDTATGEVRADMAAKSEAQAWVEAMEWALYQGLELAAEHANVALPDDFELTLFKDSSLIAGKATDIPALQMAAQQGFLTKRTFLNEMKARGVIVTVEDVDEEVAELEGEAAASVQRQMEAFSQRAFPDIPGDSGQHMDGSQGDTAIGGAQKKPSAASADSAVA